MTFNELGLSDELVSSVTALGFENPTPIQEQSIPILLTTNRDYVGLAQTGTGKTAAFGLPILQGIDTSLRHTQGLIICPTRELCIQITRELNSYAQNMSKINIVAIYGGTSISEQMRQVKKGAQIIVGTPGRMIDMIGRKAIKLDQVSTVVLDEADEMLNMGFKEDINKILAQTPASKRTWLFSATMPKDVERIANNYMEDPFKVVVGNKNSGASTISHNYVVVRGRDHYLALKRFIDYYPELFAIVFCRTRRDTRELAEKLMADGCNADALHGDLSQAQRDSVMKKFRDRSLKVLVATDVAARGIDVSEVTHVFHKELPDDIESYTHRSGRTGRAGKKGMSVAIVSPRSASRVKDIERQIKQKLNLMQVPSGMEICQRQLVELIERIKTVEVDEAAISKYMVEFLTEFDDFSKEELLQRFVAVQFNQYLEAYQKAGDLNTSASSGKGDRDKGRRGDRKGQVKSAQNAKRLFINVGKKDGFDNVGQFLGFLCRESGIDGDSVGKIDLKDGFTFFGSTEDSAEQVLNTMNRNEYEGRKLRIEYAEDNPGRRRKSSGGGDRRGGSDRRGGGERRRRR